MNLFFALVSLLWLSLALNLAEPKDKVLKWIENGSGGVRCFRLKTTNELKWTYDLRCFDAVSDGRFCTSLACKLKVRITRNTKLLEQVSCEASISLFLRTTKLMVWKFEANLQFTSDITVDDCPYFEKINEPKKRNS